MEALKVNQLRFADERFSSLLGPIAEAAIFAIQSTDHGSIGGAQQDSSECFK